MPVRTRGAKKSAPGKKAATKPSAKKGTKARVKKAVAAGRHVRGETNPWTIWVDDHADRSDSPEYVKSRKVMNELARTVAEFYYGAAPYEDHHGGGLWLKDGDGWFILRNVVGMEWSSQFCADPAKVDKLRLNARRVYAAFPDAVQELGIRKLLDTPITTAEDVARWTDSICNASLPLPKGLHVGVLAKPGKGKAGEVVAGGFHHYPAPIVDQQLFKYDDFQLWVTDEDQPIAVVPVGERGSGDGRTAVIYADRGTALAAKKDKAAKQGKALILDADDEISLRAYNDQYRKILTGDVAVGDPLVKAAKAHASEGRTPDRRVPASRYGLNGSAGHSRRSGPDA
ncbi:MAG: hypothetical protein QOG53_3415 [Frankiales bacterium]|jgi:hypothetical protein|nr:hypothetical protein [Frankiales bacterium]